MASKHLLSKSTFMYGCQCPKRLYLHKFKPDLRNPEDEQQEFIFATGTDVGILARELFPNGISAEPPNPFSYHISVEKTARFIANGHQVIYEASFNFESVLCAIDILVNKNGLWYAFEVKGSNRVKDTHIMDASLQHFVITHAGLPLEDFSIVHLDNQYVRKGALNVNKLFTSESVLEQIIENKEFIGQKINQLKTLLEEKKEPLIETGPHCFSPYQCDFTNHCKSVIENEISSREKNIDHESIKEFLNDWEFPLYFLDFETVMPAVPEFDFSRPYQQIPFQFSLHVQKSKNANPEHFEFLGDGLNDPREELIKNLLKIIEKKGSIVVWNKSFENSRLHELARDFPEYSKEIYSLADRLVDLMIPFRNKWYYLPGFNESYSIKKILPVLVPDLNYDALEIQEGGMASLIYAGLKNQTEEKMEYQRKKLLEYCKLDTLAMVKILNHLFSNI